MILWNSKSLIIYKEKFMKTMDRYFSFIFNGLIVSKRVHMLILNGQSLAETFGLKISPPHQQDVKII